MLNGWINLDDGTKQYYENDELNDPPTIEYADGSKAWLQGGKYHRLNKPASIHADGSKFYYINGKLHNAFGPACVYVRGTTISKGLRKDGGDITFTTTAEDEWWYEGERIMVKTLEEFNEVIAAKKAVNG